MNAADGSPVNAGLPGLNTIATWNALLGPLGEIVVCSHHRIFGIANDALVYGEDILMRSLVDGRTDRIFVSKQVREYSYSRLCWLTSTTVGYLVLIDGATWLVVAETHPEEHRFLWHKRFKLSWLHKVPRYLGMARVGRELWVGHSRLAFS